ncbi:NAD(P)/FAD-dependent oxidoreductase [Tessaracoccus terricola]
MPREKPCEYLVVGAGAAGLAFADALVEHVDARVTLIDRQPGPGGHWRDAYPFVRLHRASSFYGVASMPLGQGRLQTDGPEAGLAERATGAEILAYFEGVLVHLLATGRVEFHGGSTWTGGRGFVDATGRQHLAPPHARVVDATYRAAHVPATTPAPFDAARGTRVVPVGALPRVGAEHPEYVVVGSGKTATDACVWLLQQGVAPEAVCWVRPREPWMANRARVQPDPATMFQMVADTWEAAAASSSLEEFFLRLEEAEIMLRIDTSVAPTMAKAPTIAGWELDLLRRILRVVRGAHVTAVEPGRLRFTDATVPIHRDAVVVHCAASGHAYPRLVPLWGEVIRLQTIRAGFPCFNAALAGYVEATRTDDAEKNRLCPPSPLPDSLASWVEMQVRGARAAAAFMAEPDVAAWAQTTCLNPARLQPGDADRPEVGAALERVRRSAPTALARLAGLAGL